ncbi:MAG TPA: IclR family transcriptional regulator [Candidatus Baltobacteraceae bacterium]|jgi:DNA-binding IclR family transcriptional regulator|nr:IclR family transcriptional regulator [Candidatus Baltobacteraceae bacterium]
MPTTYEIRLTPTARALDVLQCVAQRAKPVSMTEIATALCLPPPTVHRIVLQLEELGYLQRALGSKRLVIGPSLAQLGLQATIAHFQGAPRHAILQAVAEKVGEHCAIGIVYKNEVLYVDSVQATRLAHLGGLRFVPGGRAPLHCTSTGKLFLAHLDKDVLQELLRVLKLERFTEMTIIDKSDFLSELATIRKRGWAFTNEEYLPGVVGCCVPVFGPRKEFIAGVSITVPVARIHFADLKQHVPMLQSAAKELSRLIERSGQLHASDRLL